MTNNKRRPLNAAMDVSADKLAFIRGGVPGSASEQAPPAAVVAPVTEKVEQVVVPVAPLPQQSAPIELENVVEATAETETQERKRTKTRSRGAANSSREEPMMSMTNLLVPLTTRLSPSTAAALKRAGLEQKLYGRQPGTVQEIAEDAIRAWLIGEGYL